MPQTRPQWITVNGMTVINDTTSGIMALAQGFHKVGLGFVRSNAKTGASLDLTSRCRHGCKYCYASNYPPFFKMQDIFYKPAEQWGRSHRELFRAFLQAYRKLAHNHFLRLFSLADFEGQDTNFWIDVLKVAGDEGVPTVVFTKTQEAVDILAPYLTRLVISRDNSARWNWGSPAWVADDDLIASYKAKHPNVVTSAMVVDEEDIAAIDADFYIAHHGPFKKYGITRRISQQQVLDIVGRRKGCTPVHRCFGCPTSCTTKTNVREESKQLVGAP